MSGREELLTQVRNGFAGDENVDELVDIFGELFDLRESDPQEYRAVLTEVRAEAARRREGAQRG